MPRSHEFHAFVNWTGNMGTGTSAYRGYSRSYEIRGSGKQSIPGSSDPAFVGDASRYNPEELLVASLSACHMLWYLHLCSGAGVVVTSYSDDAEGTMEVNADGGGRFSSVTLRPRVTVLRAGDVDRAMNLHRQAHQKCFIASSVNFIVSHVPDVTVE